LFESTKKTSNLLKNFVTILEISSVAMCRPIPFIFVGMGEDKGCGRFTSLSATTKQKLHIYMFLAYSESLSSHKGTRGAAGGDTLEGTL
jgi:hypothetical protein